jgi:hypothetical protein
LFGALRREVKKGHARAIGDRDRSSLFPRALVNEERKRRERRGEENGV